MNLLEKATTITTATAYDNGKLHSVKGGSVADFDVVRGSLATRVNAEGLIEDISTLSGELITNGDFATDLSGWVTYSNTLISWQSGGYALLDSNGGYWCKIKQSNIFEIGKTYKVILTAKSNRTDLSFHSSPIVGSFSQADTFETFEQYHTATTVDFLFGYANSGSATITIDNISVVEVIDVTNIPRIDYTDGTASILLEPQSTNLFDYSEDFSQWSAFGTPVLTGSQDDLSGNTNAYAIEFPTSNDFVRRLGVDTTGTFTYSIYAKKSIGDKWYLNCDGNVGRYDFSTESFTAGTGSITGDMIDVGNGWYRCAMTFTSINAASQARIQSDDGSTVIFWGAQLEELPHATSYIPTSGAIATRLADSITGAGDATTFNSTEGVLYFEGSYLSSVIGNTISLSNGGNTDVIYFRTDTINRFKFFVGSNSYLTSFNDYDVTENHKIALLWSANSFKVFIDGQKKHDVSISFSPSVNYDRINFSNPTGGSSNFIGKVKSVITYNTALTDAELECLTTI